MKSYILQMQTAPTLCLAHIVQIQLASSQLQGPGKKKKPIWMLLQSATKF